MKINISALIPVFVLILGILQVNAQECVPYYAAREGTVVEMTSYDKKDKVTGTNIQTVKDVKTIGDRTEWTIGTVSKDEKGKELASGDLKMSCEAGIFKMDMKNFIDQTTLDSFKEMEVTIDATDLVYPSDLDVGQTLEEGRITMKVSSSGMTIMTMVVRIYDREVVAKEDITTPAGTFSCYKMTSTIETKSMFSMVVKSTDWIAKNVGSVRSESYDSGGKLMGYTVLTSFKQ